MFKLKLLDELVKMTATVVAAVLTGGALCEYLLKPLWHVLIENR